MTGMDTDVNQALVNLLDISRKNTGWSDANPEVTQLQMHGQPAFALWAPIGSSRWTTRVALAECGVGDKYFSLRKDDLSSCQLVLCMPLSTSSGEAS
jgi:hypothetical protein